MTLRTAGAVATLTAAFLTHDWRRSQIGWSLARAFTPPPDIEIWQWADENVLLQNEDAAEPGEYRSAKTPWTKRLQELMRRPEMWVWNFQAGKYVRVPVTEINVQKSSQSGYSEGCLNGIRWRAVFRPCNVIYAIDSADEARKIARRLLRSFKFLDQSIFTGDPDDIKTLEFQLRGMELFFYGSFSSGKFANKQAPLNINDEVEEHGKNILADSASRKKTSTGGLQINLSKPKLKGGPINRAFLRGNQEEFFVPCPHCHHYQYLTFFPEERDVPFSEEFIWVNRETGENFDSDPNSSGDEQSSGRTSVRDSEDEKCEQEQFNGGARNVRLAETANPAHPPFEIRNSKFVILPKPLPLGQTRKLKTGRFVFEHCKNLLGKWDRYRIQTETYYECAACQGAITDSHKRWMLDRGLWLPLEITSSPGIVSQQMSDFYSEDELSTFGKMADEYIEAKHESHEALTHFYNHRCGKALSEEANKTEVADILRNRAGIPLWFVDAPNTEGQIVRNIFSDEPSAQRLTEATRQRGFTAEVIHSACPPYKRGQIPFPLFQRSPKHPRALILGSDVGGNYARWVIGAMHTNMTDCAIIDWGEELDPDSIREIVAHKTWPMRLNPADQVRINSAWMDARWRTSEVYKSCLSSRGIIQPTKGLGGQAAINVKLWTYVPVSTMFHGPQQPLYELHYNDQRAKDALYIRRIKRMRARLWFPVDVEDDPVFMEEMTAEHQEQNKRGHWYWPDKSKDPNHYADAVKELLLGFDFLTRHSKSAG